MEILAVFLSGLIAVISPTGIITETRIEKAIRDRTFASETIVVRVDSQPNYGLLRGKADKIRIATRGLYPIPGARIEALEIETGEVDVKLLRNQESASVLNPIILEEPLQLALRVVIGEADLNQALESSEVQSYVENTIRKASGGRFPPRNYRLDGMELKMLREERLQIKLNLQSENLAATKNPEIVILLEFGFTITQGRSIKIIEPVAEINGRKVSYRLLENFLQRINQVLDLRTWESLGVTGRILQLEIVDGEINLAAIVSLEQSNAIYVQ